MIEVPNYDSVFRQRMGESWGGYHTPRHTLVFTPQTLQRMLHQNGWEVVRWQHYGTMDPFIIWWLSHMERKQTDWNHRWEKHFFNLLGHKILRAPVFWWQRFISFGILLVIARPRS
ncbi:MAG: hypothetical protein HC880_06640 [Bacteroidia bacterium]|nr:hypothetical protein [Bacteroidia bacterium]